MRYLRLYESGIRYKVGDKVIITNTGDIHFNSAPGAIYTIVHHNSDININLYLLQTDEIFLNNFWRNKKDFRKATSKEIEAYEIKKNIDKYNI